MAPEARMAVARAAPTTGSGETVPAICDAADMNAKTLALDARLMSATGDRFGLRDVGLRRARVVSRRNLRLSAMLPNKSAPCGQDL